MITSNKYTIVRYVTLVIALIFIAVFIYDNLTSGPVAEKYQKKLEVEYKLIDHFPGALLKRYSASDKPGNALVHGSFQTKVNFNKIKDYYGAELINNGWRYWKTEKVKDWGRDLGGLTIKFCKNDYIATLQYYGDKSDSGTSYGLSLSWGLDTCQ